VSALFWCQSVLEPVLRNCANSEAHAAGGQPGGKLLALVSPESRRLSLEDRACGAKIGPSEEGGRWGG
jgi:hypothetical protein